MSVPRVFVIAAAAALLSAQDKKTVDLNPGFALAAEYLVHSIPTPSGGLVADDYLVVEVTLSGPKVKIDVSAGQFELRINGRKFTLSPESAGPVAASIKYPDWTPQRPAVTGTVGNGNDGVIIGPRPQVEHFPGDPTVRPTQTPAPVGNPSGIEKPPPPSIDDQVAHAALPEIEQLLPVTGLIFFQFRGKTKSIKSVELLYEGPAGKALLKL